MSTTTDPHLWEVDHPYYCAEGNWFHTGEHTLYASWAEFAVSTKGNFFEGNALYDWDDDLNFLFRWDWKRAEADDYETAEELAEARKTDRLMLFYMLQRKGRNLSVEVAVTEADEPAVREWLKGKAEYMRTMWEPFL